MRHKPTSDPRVWRFFMEISLNKRQRILRESLATPIKNAASSSTGRSLFHKGVAALHNTYLKAAGSIALPVAGAISPIPIPGSDAPFILNKHDIAHNMIRNPSAASTARAGGTALGIVGGSKLIKKIDADSKRRRGLPTSQ
jgi:hypothetical protein